MIKVALLSALLSLVLTDQAAAQTDPVQIGAEAIRDRFVAAVQACGVEPAFVPAVAVRTAPSLATYVSADRTLYLSRYDELAEPIKATMRAWAADGTLGLDAERQFAELFNVMVVPHELGHALQAMWGRQATLDRWESETEANRIAFAFWALDPENAERLPLRVENATRFLGRLPSPVPEGRSAREHVNTDYRALLADPQAYGWYQGAVMRAAWEDRHQADFCDLVRLNASAGQS